MGNFPRCNSDLSADICFETYFFLITHIWLLLRIPLFSHCQDLFSHSLHDIKLIQFLSFNFNCRCFVDYLFLIIFETNNRYFAHFLCLSHAFVTSTCAKSIVFPLSSVVIIIINSMQMAREQSARARESSGRAPLAVAAGLRTRWQRWRRRRRRDPPLRSDWPADKIFNKHGLAHPSLLCEPAAKKQPRQQTGSHSPFVFCRTMRP